MTSLKKLARSDHPAWWLYYTWPAAIYAGLWLVALVEPFTGILAENGFSWLLDQMLFSVFWGTLGYGVWINGEGKKYTQTILGLIGIIIGTQVLASLITLTGNVVYMIFPGIMMALCLVLHFLYYKRFKAKTPLNKLEERKANGFYSLMLWYFMFGANVLGFPLSNGSETFYFSTVMVLDTFFEGGFGILIKSAEAGVLAWLVANWMRDIVEKRKTRNKELKLGLVDEIGRKNG